MPSFLILLNQVFAVFALFLIYEIASFQIYPLQYYQFNFFHFWHRLSTIWASWDLTFSFIECIPSKTKCMQICDFFVQYVPALFRLMPRHVPFFVQFPTASMESPVRNLFHNCVIFGSILKAQRWSHKTRTPCGMRSFSCRSVTLHRCAPCCHLLPLFNCLTRPLDGGFDSKTWKPRIVET